MKPARRPAALLLALAACSASLAQGGGDAARGKVLYESRCVACHSVDAHRVGPAHAGVFGRVAGTAAGYDYSPALAKSNLRWSTASLEAWLADPEKLVPGQKMGYAVPLPQDRADLVAYLATLKAH